MALPYVTENKVVKIAKDIVKEEVPEELPEVTTEDKNKYLHTNEDTGALEWSEVAGGGSGLYAHSITLTLEDQPYTEGFVLLSSDSTPITSSQDFYNIKKLTHEDGVYNLIYNGGSNYVTIERIASDQSQSITIGPDGASLNAKNITNWVDVVTAL